MIIDISKTVQLYNDFSNSSLKIYYDQNDSYYLFKNNDTLNNISFESKYLEKIKDYSWDVSWITGEESTKKLIFTILAYLQQYIIIFLGLIALLQIWVHLYYFANFNRLPFSKKHKTWIQLDYKSNIHEFGLERWNQALNNIYWIITPVLIIPLISKYSQLDVETNDIGQVLIRWIVPLLFLSPMIFTIIARQKKMTDLWSIIRNESEENVEKYHKQTLWPLDKNFASKLGIVIAFALLTYLIGDALTHLHLP